MTKHVPPPTGVPLDGPELTQDALDRRLAIQQRERERTLRRLRRLREKASTEIDRLLEFLNASDDYVQTELEQDDLDEEDGTENEPSLGALDHPMNQTDAWTPYQGFAWMVDCEQDPSDDEPALGWHDDPHGFADMASRGPHEDEPSLGSSPNVDQRHWETGQGNDYERA
ncbi:hypothetical protein [Bradyrhizobium sp. MOS002]|uniref:hypothetical protein n=1 Tax=Bradyrhizobium sp. MOS002 TaxID=2133947 RepID=UPI000D11F3D9|nr:hypothetical protein [Bradyrhizobium sp. MOS002]PSO30523.1 hypothetical protein C7G41_21240 [Bradyrhizobium sp. MOS002]